MYNLKKSSPEYFTFRIYKAFTYIRIPTFWILLFFWVIDFLYLKMGFNFWRGEIFISILIKMIYFLISIGAFTAAFITIAIEIIKSKTEPKDVAMIWSNLVKYTIYPFVVAGLISVVIFLKNINIYNSPSFSLFILFTYLTLNTIYTTIKIAEILINEAWVG